MHAKIRLTKCVKLAIVNLISRVYFFHFHWFYCWFLSENSIETLLSRNGSYVNVQNSGNFFGDMPVD